MSNPNATPTDPPPSYDSAAEHATIPPPEKPTHKKQPSKAPLPLFPLEIPILTHLKGKRIILASASPRRRQLLAQIGLSQVEIHPSTLPENLPKHRLSPLEYVTQTSSRKCLDVYERLLRDGETQDQARDPDLVISADTVIVTSSGQILEKPTSATHHLQMLRNLRDQVSHRVFTAVTCLAPREDARSPGYNCETVVEETKVVFDATIKDEWLEAYVKTREGADKAGGYAIQGMGALLVERIEGDYGNVVGLPLRVTMGVVERVCLDQDGDDFSEEDG